MVVCWPNNKVRNNEIKMISLYTQRIDTNRQINYVFLCIIPAKTNSKRLVNKNIKKINNQH